MLAVWVRSEKKSPKKNIDISTLYDVRWHDRSDSHVPGHLLTIFFLRSALISATDPVATLSIMGSPDVRAHPLVYSLVFGESMLNDAVSIVVFR